MRYLVRALCVAWIPALLPPAALAGQTVVGLRAGYGVSNIYGTDIGSPGPTDGAVGGVWLRVPLTDRLALQAEGDLAARGFELSVPLVGQLALDLHYFDIPVILQLHLDRGGTVTPVFSVGAVYSVRRSCDVSVDAGLLSATTSCEDLNRNVEFFRVEHSQISALVGAGVQWTLGRMVLVLEGRGQLSVGESVHTRIDPSALGWGTARTGGVTVQAAVGLPLG